MGSLAGLLQDLGMKVTGSDGKLYPPMSDFLDSKKILRAEDYSAANLSGETWGFDQPHPDLVIIGNAISRGHVEAEIVEKLEAEGRCEKLSFAAALARFAIEDKKSFVVCGTHGKTSTTTQMAWALESLDKSPGFFIGGIPSNFGEGARVGEGRCFVSEGDEYDTAYWDKESKFLHYKPTWALCTGVELDHVDIYDSLEQVERSFQKLVGKTAEGWVMVDKSSAPLAEPLEKIESLLIQNKKRVFRYGWDESSAYHLKSVTPVCVDESIPKMGSEICFESPRWGRCTVRSPLSGDHNALNTLGIIATLAESGELQNIKQAQCYLDSFKGVKRRQEEVYTNSTWVVLDDFAHHPTAIRETIASVKKQYPEHKLFAFFEPRSASSARNVFQNEFARCFEKADRVFLSPPTKKNIPAAEALDVQKIKKDLESKNIPTFVSPEIPMLAEQAIVEQGKLSCKSVALIMSNGSFGGLHQYLISRLVVNGRAGNAQEQKGQAVIEYLLFMALVLGVAVGIFFPLASQFFERIQGTIATNSAEVLAQDPMGIPLSWVALSGDRNWDGQADDFSDGITGGGQGIRPGAAGGGGRGPNGDNGADGAGGGDAGGGAGGAGGGAGDQGRARGQGMGRLSDSSGGGAGGGRGGSGQGGSSLSGDVSSQDGSVNIRRRQGTGAAAGADDASFGSESSGSEERKNSGGSQKQGQEAEEDGETEGVIGRKQAERYDGRQTASQEGGCEDIDLMTLIKLLATAGLIVMGAVVLLSGRGGGKNAK